MNKKILFLFLFANTQTENLENNIAVIGIGRLGLCTALCFEKAGYNVLGVDLNQNYIDQINNKTLKSSEPLVCEYLQNSKNFKSTCDLKEALDFSDIFYIIVDTPSTTQKEAYDHSKLSKALAQINRYKVKKKNIVIGCTVFPGYINKIGNFLLKDCAETSLSYNPEFIAQGNIIYGLQNPDIVLIGEGSKEAGDKLEDIYKKVCLNKPKICRMSCESAEITKLAINCFITTKIAFANMIGDIADKTNNTDKFKILEAVGADKRIGNLYLKPGYGFGGPCFARDNRALGNYAFEVGVEPIIPDATDNSNKFHAQFMTEQELEKNLPEYIFENVGYKDNCPMPIIEESQKLVVAENLAKRGKKVIILDNHAVIEEVKQKFGNIFEYRIKIN